MSASVMGREAGWGGRPALDRADDAILVALARQGSESAFSALDDRYRRRLLAYAGQILHSDSRAEDVVQASLLAAWLALQRGEQVRHAGAWLHRIVHNRALNAVRDAGETLSSLSPELPAGDPEQEFVSRLELRDTLARLAGLPSLQREALLGTAVHGRSREEVGHAMGLSGAAVRGLAYRARVALRSGATALLPPPMLAFLSRRGGAGAIEAAERGLALGGGTAATAIAASKGGAMIATATATAVLAGLAPHVIGTPAHHPSAPVGGARGAGVIVGQARAPQIGIPTGDAVRARESAANVSAHFASATRTMFSLRSAVTVGEPRAMRATFGRRGHQRASGRSTGVASTGVASTGVASTGVASTGVATGSAPAIGRTGAASSGGSASGAGEQAGSPAGWLVPGGAASGRDGSVAGGSPDSPVSPPGASSQSGAGPDASESGFGHDGAAEASASVQTHPRDQPSMDASGASPGPASTSGAGAGSSASTTGSVASQEAASTWSQEAGN